MQNVSDLFNSIWENRNHYVETKVTIDGVEYGESSILSLSTSGKLFSESVPTIGSCVSGELDITIVPSASAIPRMAEIKVYNRVRDASRTSEWIPRGTYYIDTRSKDKDSGFLTIHAYDAMMKMEQDYCQTEGSQGQWPKTDSTVVSEICTKVGISLDSRVNLNKGISIQYPGFGDSAYTIREVLGFIGCAYCGNWFIAPNGNLMLSRFGSIPKESSYLVEENGNCIVFGGDKINV